MKVFLTIAFYRFKSFYRDIFTFFFSLILPIIFAIIFGFVFGGSGDVNGENTIKIGILDNNDILIKALEKIEGISISIINNFEELRDLVLKGSLDAGILFDGKNFNLIINFASFQQKPFLRTLGDTVANAYSLKEAGVEGGFLRVEEEFIDPGKARVSQLGYLLPGVMSFSIASSLFAMIALFGYYRKRKVLKKFALTPISSFSFISGMITGNFLISFFSSIFVLFFTQIIFNIKFSINWGYYFLSLSSSILGMMALGIFITSLFKDPQTANNVGNLLVNIMIFFSGVYMPLDFLPDYLRKFGQILPLYYVAKSLRISVGVEEGDLSFILKMSLVMITVFVILVGIFGRNILEMEE
ncbi:MAG: ABC transporter permease [Dictyoglomaceae bacterium]